MRHMAHPLDFSREVLRKRMQYDILRKQNAQSESANPTEGDIGEMEQKNRQIALQLAVFLLPPLLMLGLEWRANGMLGTIYPDAQLYLSIADNAVSTGHFIQTARPIAGFVVPPGVPFILLLLRLAHFSLPMIAALHFLLMGGGALLLYRTGLRLFGRWALIAPGIYTLAYLRCRLYLGNVYVEHWYLFLLCLIVWLLYRDMSAERRLTALNPAALAAMMIRPVLAPVYLAVLACTLAFCLRRRRFRLAAFALLLPMVLLGLNLWVNYRETGELVLLQNYSGTDLFRAFSPNAAGTRLENDVYDDAFYFDVYRDPATTMSEKSRLLRDCAKAYIRQEPLRCAGLVLRRIRELYLKICAPFSLSALAGGIWLSRVRRGAKAWFPLAVNLFLVLLSGFGIPEMRYSIPIWPLASLHIAALAHGLSSALPKLRRQSSPKDAAPGA